MKKSLIVAALTGALLASSPVVAQSAFDGGYAGANGAYSIGVIDITAPGADRDYVRGLAGGAFVGYGTSFDGIYVGVEGALEYGDLKLNGSSGGTAFTATRRESASVTARLGYTPSAETLLFASGGLNLSSWEVQDGSTSTEWVDSYRIGIGADQFVAENVFARVSYDLDIARDPTAFTPVTLDQTTSTAKVGLGFRF